jgi:hypothetical protein
VNKIGRLANRGTCPYPPMSLSLSLSHPRPSQIHSTSSKIGILQKSNRVLLPPTKSLTNTPSGQYDFATVHKLVNECPILHVSFLDPEHPFPVVLPMLGCTGSFSNQTADPETSEQDVYIHGYVSGRMFKNSKGEGLPITVAASYASPSLTKQS